MAETIHRHQHDDAAAVRELRGNKLRLGSLLRPLKPLIFFFVGAFKSTVPFVVIDGQIYNIPPKMSNSDYLSLLRGRYENPEISLLRNLGPANTIIEVGSNIGVVARHAFLKNLQAGGTYICVEPNPNSQAALEKNMARARRASPSKTYTTVSAAVSAPKDEGEKCFVVRPTLDSGLAVHVRKAANETVIRVPTRSLSSLKEEFAPDGYTLIMDAEGGEIDVLFKDPKALSGVDEMVIELHRPELTGSRKTPGEMLSQLRKLGFNVEAQVADSYFLRRTRPANIPG